PAEGLGRQPDLVRCAGPVGPDVRVADVLATGAFGPGFPQPAPAGPAGGVGLAPMNRRAFSFAFPAGRGRIPAAGGESPEVRARPGPSGQRPPSRTARAGLVSPSRSCWPDTLVGLTTSRSTGGRPHPQIPKQLEESRRRRTSRMARPASRDRPVGINTN